MTVKLRVSKSMWNYYGGEITIDLITCLIADKIYGWWISHTGFELLRDLNLITEKGNINKQGRLVLASQLHDKYHREENGIEIIKPITAL